MSTDLAVLDEAGALSPVEQEQLEVVAAQARAIAEAVGSIEVNDEKSANDATEFLARVARHRKDGDTRRLARTEPYRDTVAAINAGYKSVLDSLKEADGTVRGKLQVWVDAREQQRREEEARLEKEQLAREAAARAERERQEAEAEAYRIDAERDARIKAEAAKKSDDEAAAKEAEEAAAKAAEARTAEAATKALPTYEIPKAHVAPAAPLKSASGGASTQKVWKFEIVDKALVPDRHKVVKDSLIRDEMRETLRATDAPPNIPGVRFYQEDRLAVRAS
jgi:type IV secretory pathway VirB10-like protein